MQTILMQKGYVFVVVINDGDEYVQFPMSTLHDGGFWCAGQVGRDIESLAERVHKAWFAPPCQTESFDELRALEAMKP